MQDIVKARIRKPADGGLAYIEIQRAKFKWWRLLGKNVETDRAFKLALRDGAVVWLPKIIEPKQLFD